MIQNNSCLPIYTDISQQNHRNVPMGESLYDLISPSGTFLPIQFTRDASNDEISSLKLYDAETGLATELLDPTGKHIFGDGFNDDVLCIIAYMGGYLVGTKATTYKGIACNKLVLIKENGDIDNDFNFTGSNPVNAVLEDAGNIICTSYSGGTYTMHFLDSTGTSLGVTYPITFNGEVKKIIKGLEGFYACGSFTTSTKYATSPETTYYLIHLNADYSRDETFTFNFIANNRINDLAIQSDGKLVICGFFTTIQYTTVKYLARILTTGLLDIYDVDKYFNGEILCIKMNSDDTFYLGGKFTTYYSTAKHICKFSANLTFLLGGEEFDYDVTILRPHGSKMLAFTNNTLFSVNDDLTINPLFVDNNNFYINNTILDLLVINFNNYIIVGDISSDGLYPTNIRQNTVNGCVDIGSYFNIIRGSSYDTLIYNTEFILRDALTEGYKYLSFTDGMALWYSEVFLVKTDLSDCIKFEFYDTEDLPIDNGDINLIYSDNSVGGYKNLIYLLEYGQKIQIGHPEYLIEETVLERSGRMFFESQNTSKKYKFSVVLPEFLIDIISLARISDFVTITDGINTYNVNYLKFKENWINQTNIASIDFEIFINNIIKKVGKLSSPSNDLGIGEMAIESTFIVR